ncbi:MAG TPA: hypothetical protein VNL37_05885, partial [Candidatus Polarisedimenticolia bacterium]|nr:hypothetical protein [Candidatus Polarisedimenticolia bacterium]
GRSREAESRYRAILAGGPSAAAETGLGDLARWEGRYGEADTHYRAALKIDPRDAAAAEGLRRNRSDGGVTLTARYGWFDDSNDFRRRTSTLFVDLLQMRRLALRVGAVRVGYEQTGDGTIDRTALPLQGRLWVGRWLSLRGGVARNRYGDGAPDTTSWFLHGDLSPGADRVRVRLGYHHYDLIDESDPFGENFYNQAQSLEVVRQKIDIDEGRAGMLLRFTGRLSLNSDVALGDISDGNRRATAYSRLSYRLPGTPRVDLFGAFYYQSVRDDSLLYWAPSNFQSYALGARVEGDGARRFHYVAEGQLAFHPLEDHLLGGQVYGVAAWDLGQRYSLRLTGNYLAAPVQRGAGSHYDATYLSFGLVARLGALPAAARGH